MEQVRNYGDERTLAFCAFCGGETGTKDHCPSKIFLDDPYPENLPVVPACRPCNSGFSLDEEYLACLLSSVIAGSTDPHLQPRVKTRRILNDKPALRAMLEQARCVIDGKVHFALDHKRTSGVLIKLAQGHALYELHDLYARAPERLEYRPLECFSREEREHFEAPYPARALPEVGSRAMQRFFVGGFDVTPSGWIEVQPDRYRYKAMLWDYAEVRIVIHEYLACRAQWSLLA